MKYVLYILVFSEICSQGSNYQHVSIGSDNGLVPNRWQAIIWNKGGLLYLGIYASLSLKELMHKMKYNKSGKY